MPKHFTLEEAQRLLPQLERSLQEAVSVKNHLDEAEAELRGASERIIMLGGALVNQERLLSQRGRRDALAARLKESIDAIEQSGCLVKDLDLGLVDFPTFFKSEEVYLCWRLGEPRILYWHGVREGFRERKAVDQEFLDNHRGDLPS